MKIEENKMGKSMLHYLADADSILTKDEKVREAKVKLLYSYRYLCHSIKTSWSMLMVLLTKRSQALLNRSGSKKVDYQNSHQKTPVYLVIKNKRVHEISAAVRGVRELSVTLHDDAAQQVETEIAHLLLQRGAKVCGASESSTQGCATPRAKPGCTTLAGTTSSRSWTNCWTTTRM